MDRRLALHAPAALLFTAACQPQPRVVAVRRPGTASEIRVTDGGLRAL